MAETTIPEETLDQLLEAQEQLSESMKENPNGTHFTDDEIARLILLAGVTGHLITDLRATRAEVERLQKYAPSPEMEALLAKSSLGTPEALAARDLISQDAARLVVRYSEVMADRDRLRVTLAAVGELRDSLRATASAIDPGEGHMSPDLAASHAAADAERLAADRIDRILTDADPVSLADVREPIERCEYVFKDNGQRCVKPEDHIEGIGGDVEHARRNGGRPI